MPHSIRNCLQIFSIVTLVFGFFVPGQGQVNNAPLKLGEVITISSTVLGEDRAVLVSLPADFNRSAQSYPVLYMLDGGTNFLHAAATAEFLARAGHIPPIIVVAIPNTNRQRDFTPTAVADRPGTGGADKFLQFMETELIPFVSDNYRGGPYRVLAGHSLCGMFSVYTLTRKPGMFDGYIAISPYVMWDDNMPLDALAKRLAVPYPEKARMFITVGDEPDYMDGLKRLRKLLNSENAKSIDMQMEAYPTDTHGSVPLKSVYAGLEYIFQNWQLNVEVADKGLDAILAHYKAISTEYGYPVKPPEAIMNNIGYRLVGQKHYKKGIAVFKYNVETYPESSNVYDSLGEALEAAGQLREALIQYSKAIELAKKKGDANLAVYKQHSQEAMKKLSVTGN